MNISATIKKAFPSNDPGWGVSDDFIEQNPNLMELPGEVDYLRYVPAYMNWCVRNNGKVEQLVGHYTLGALAEYGRCKDEKSLHMSFKFLCDDEQRIAVRAFLAWSMDNMEFVKERQISRSIQNWN